MGRVRQSYTAKEKLDVIKYAEAHGNQTACQEFNVGESSVREWCKHKANLLKFSEQSRLSEGRLRTTQI
ncbi:hypothetical protein DPMN_116330 [Dreissena polymorpha]|uniref:HTH psq-type domain-containing protein n=1 Tax=Dreissena polymorpha TaxID=45954 RepID=A0A9D4KND8_DREPO|nr:hypothetical protein DPMN_116326 [Dreissena polymorpha]KAH3842826.1 hypothetical protein DPMN_116330 [Dreissena polymorpha]